MYDVIIIGAGPAGIFAALELSNHDKLRVLLLEQGPDLEQRSSRSPQCLISGWGGAGAFSDGKLTLSREVGGQLSRFMPEHQVDELIQRVDEIYLRFGAPDQVYGTNEDEIRALIRRATLADLQLIPARIRHLGTERCLEVLKATREELEKSVEIRTGVQVSRILTEDNCAVGVETKDGEQIACRYLIAAPGRAGAAWLTSEAARLGMKQVNNPVDVGVRIELPAAVLRELAELTFEPKLIFYSPSFDDRVRTFCMCPQGEVITENYNGVTTVNGHSYANRKTDNTNLALLVSTTFTEPFHEPIAYGKYLASLANILGETVIVQRLGDLEAGRRSTPERIARGIVQPTLPSATPGDLSFVLPYRYLTDVLEMIDALDKLAPGVASRHTLLYGVEVKFYSSRSQLSPSLETEIENLFTIGDGAGVTRGLVQASASGIVAAREILRRTSSS